VRNEIIKHRGNSRMFNSPSDFAIKESGKYFLALQCCTCSKNTRSSW